MIWIITLVVYTADAFTVSVPTMRDILPEIVPLISQTGPTGNERSDLFVSVVKALAPADQHLVDLIERSEKAIERLAEIDRLFSQKLRDSGPSHVSVRPASSVIAFIDRFVSRGSKEDFQHIKEITGKNPQQVEGLQTVVWTKTGDHVNLIMLRKDMRANLNKVFERIKRLWETHQRIQILYLLRHLSPMRASPEFPEPPFHEQMALREWLEEDQTPRSALKKLEKIITEGYSTKSIKAAFANVHARLLLMIPDPLLASMEIDRSLGSILEQTAYADRFTTTRFIE
jgi:hypothetical protein